MAEMTKKQAAKWLTAKTTKAEQRIAAATVLGLSHATDAEATIALHTHIAGLANDADPSGIDPNPPVTNEQILDAIRALEGKIEEVREAAKKGDEELAKTIETATKKDDRTVGSRIRTIWKNLNTTFEEREAQNKEEK